MKVSVVFGTRPEAIKLAPVILALKADPRIECRVCVTGQHREMLHQSLEVFGIQPDVDLKLMQANQTLAELTARVMEALDGYLAADKPDLVLVQGDTTTVFCATLAAFYHRIPVGHVEAGLRTGNLMAPWPEEANRVLTSRLATLHFAPTQEARRNLIAEGVAPEAVVVTGNTVIDALLLAVEKVHQRPPVIPDLPSYLQPAGPGAAGTRRLVLITGHRRENFGVGFENICGAISDLAKRFPEDHFIYPVHLNPRVREPVLRILGGSEIDLASPKNCNGLLPNVHLIEPLPYLPFVALMESATLILTDSGGVQEEAPSLGKPVLVMRDTTERPEAVQAGTVKLVGTDRRKIVEAVTRLLTDRAAYDSMARAHNPYGDGLAASRIVRSCVEQMVSPQAKA